MATITSLQQSIYKKQYNVTTTANAFVSPFGAYVSQDITADANQYGTPISALWVGGGSANPAIVFVGNTASNSTLRVYSNAAGTVSVAVVFKK